MKILYILKHNPWGIGGGCYACRNYLELFSEIFKYDTIDVLICSEYLKEKKEAEFKNCTFITVPPRRKLPQYLSPITHIMHRHQNVAENMIKKSDYDYCIFDHNSIAGSLVDLCRVRNIKTIVLNHNCELEYFRDNNSKIRNMLLLHSVRKNERGSYLKCDYNIFLTEEDRVLFNKTYGLSSTKCIVGGCFFNKNEEIEENNRPFNLNNPRIVISGTIGNIQNLDGINYFLDELYPLLPQYVQIIITGKNPPQTLIDKIKKYSNIEIKPNPKDIMSIIKSCDIFLCPTRLGGGMKLRIMDGIRCCIPILSHKVSARGYKEFEDKGFLYSFEGKHDFLDGFNSIVKKIDEDKDFKNNMFIQSKSITFDGKLEYFKNLFIHD